MEEIISPALQLVAAVFDLIGDERAKHYFKQATETALELQREEAKPYDQQDHAKIVQLKKQGVVLEKAALQEYQIHKARKEGQ